MSVQQEKFKAIADKIREKTNTEDLIKPNDFADKIDDVYEAGKTSEYDRFWDNYQSNGERKGYNYAFQSLCWTDETYNPKYPIIASSATNLYVNNKNITDTKVTIDLRGGFINNTFSYSGLKTIQEIKVDKTTTHGKDTTGATNGFNGIYDLVEVTFTGEWTCGDLNIGYSHYLSKASIISIFNVLSGSVEGLTLTISRKAVNNAFGIDVDNETTYPEGSEYYNLRWSKRNWTVNYIG